MASIANADQATSWDGLEGEAWAADQDRHDRAVHGYHDRLLAAAEVSATEHVVDIGCGCGQSTRDAARRASSGAAFGVDLSRVMLEHARERARQEGLGNVAFERVDAQVHEFEAGAFDVAISRFGAMFFADPVAAFRNVAAAVRRHGRLAVVAWQPLEQNEWIASIRAVFSMGRDLPAPAIGAPGPFGLADPGATRDVLEASGWTDVDVEDVREPLIAGVDEDDALEFVRHLPAARGLQQDLDPTARAQAIDDLRVSLAAHQTEHGVTYAAAAWLYTARRV